MMSHKEIMVKAKIKKTAATVAKRKATAAKGTTAIPKKIAPTKAAGGVAGILAAFGAREGTNRAKLLARLARDIGRPVAVADLMTAVYGKDDGDHGKLGMVMKGAFVMVEKRKPGYRITKSGERGEIAFTLSAVR